MKSIYLLLLVLAIISCVHKSEHNNSSQKESNPNTLEIPIDNSEFEIQSKIKETHYIALETTHYNKISSVDKIEFFDNRIFIFDEKLNKIFIFNDKGKFLHQIDNKGRGPYEYNYISDFCINPIDSCIRLLDVGGRKVLYLDSSYNVCDKISISFFCNKFLITNDENYLFFTNNQITPTADTDEFYNFILTKTNGEIIENFMKIPKEKHNLVVSEPYTFTSSNSKAIFSLPFDNSIYYVNNDSVHLKYEISFGKFNIPVDFLNSLKDNQNRNKALLQMKLLNSLVKDGYAYSLHSLFENDTFLYFQFRRKTKLYSVLYDKKRKSIKTGENKLKSLNSVFLGQPVALNNSNELISVIFPYKYYAQIRETQSSGENAQYKYQEYSEGINIIKSANKFDNPILKISKL